LEQLQESREWSGHIFLLVAIAWGLETPWSIDPEVFAPLLEDLEVALSDWLVLWY
jgi:hypothetical protein